MKQNRLGVVLGAEKGFKIASNPDTVLAPDIAFIKQERITLVGETEKFWSGAPDLAVDVLSSSDTVYEVEDKVAAWLGSGSQAVWAVNRKLRSIHIHRPGASIQTLTENDILHGEHVVPGFQLAVAELFS